MKRKIYQKNNIIIRVVALAGSIESQNWDDICKYAMLLKNTSPLLFTGKRKVELPKDFIILDTFFHFQSLAVVEAAESREIVSLNIEYEKLVLNEITLGLTGGRSIKQDTISRETKRRTGKCCVNQPSTICNCTNSSRQILSI